MAKYFKPETDPKLFFCPCCGNSIVDIVLLNNLDKLRELYGKPIYVNSGFRCKDHNFTVEYDRIHGKDTPLLDLCREDQLEAVRDHCWQSASCWVGMLSHIIKDGYFTEVDELESK